MKLIEIILLLYLIYLVKSDPFPSIPGGHEPININPAEVYSSDNLYNYPENTNISNSSIKIMQNGTIMVNTTKMDKRCTPECYTSCRILFPEYINQKYCIINVCKCRVIDKEAQSQNKESTIYQNDVNSFTIFSEKQNMNFNESGNVVFFLQHKKKNVNEGNKNIFSCVVFYLFIILVSLGYEYLTVDFIKKKCDIDLNLFGFMNHENEYKKYRILNDNYNEDINNKNELNQCLL